ncbi:MAG: LacI family DNA-binding transcriptional regulator [Clostridia bacterium]
MLVTIADVAKMAGVSAMTVSRVINHSSRVSDKTRAQVNKAIELLDYRPNMIAKGLATGHSGLIAYVMSNLSDPFHALVSKGIENACFPAGYTVIIYDASSDRRVEECVNMLIERKIDGAIFHHLNISEQQKRMLESSNVRCVMIDNEQELADMCSVDSDNYLGARMAAEHLIARGHQRIECISGYLGGAQVNTGEYIDSFQRKIWQDRTRGYRDVLCEHGLAPGRCYEGSGTVRQGFLLAQHYVREILRATPRPTAIYCENDMLALGALSELLEMGLKVPTEMAIVGHDGLEMSTILYPRITTVMQPRYEMGFTAAEKLMGLICDRAAPSRTVMHSVLFEGDTT